MSDMDETVRHLVQKVDRVEERLADHDTRLSVMETTVTDLRENTALIRDDLKDNSSITRAAAAGVQEIKTQQQTAFKVLGGLITVLGFVLALVQASA